MKEGRKEEGKEGSRLASYGGERGGGEFRKGLPAPLTPAALGGRVGTRAASGRPGSPDPRWGFGREDRHSASCSRSGMPPACTGGGGALLGQENAGSSVPPPPRQWHWWGRGCGVGGCPPQSPELQEACPGRRGLERQRHGEKGKNSRRDRPHWLQVRSFIADMQEESPCSTKICLYTNFFVTFSVLFLYNRTSQRVTPGEGGPSLLSFALLQTSDAGLTLEGAACLIRLRRPPRVLL